MYEPSMHLQQSGRTERSSPAASASCPPYVLPRGCAAYNLSTYRKDDVRLPASACPHSTMQRDVDVVSVHRTELRSCVWYQSLRSSYRTSDAVTTQVISSLGAQPKLHPNRISQM
ncbi:hypothetical protein INR49_032374 [Caranx melampygus]|nr:hypothetical protein INR49_032374 [Caranx melampygus]